MMQNARVFTACMTLTRSDFVENKLMKTCFVAVLLMPGARESVQGDRSCADLKLSSSCVMPLPVLLTREALKRARERRWVLLKIPRCDIDGVGEGK